MSTFPDCDMDKIPSHWICSSQLLELHLINYLTGCMELEGIASKEALINMLAASHGM